MNSLTPLVSVKDPAMRTTTPHLLIGCLVVHFMIGCGPPAPSGGENRPDVIPVTGEVTLGGKPLEGAHVSFIPAGTARGAFGVTDAEGKFTLQTFEEGDGAIAGSYTVTVIKKSKPPADAGKDRAIDAPPVEVDTKSLIPEKYGDPLQSGFSAEVKAGGENHFKFELQE